MPMAKRNPEPWHPRVAPPPPSARRWSDEAIVAAIAGWQGLADEERDSVTIAAFVLADLSWLGAPANILGQAARVIEDEIRHVGVCEGVIRALGGTPCPKPARDRDRPVTDRREERLAHDLVAGFVAGEPLSAACFAAARRLPVEPLVRWAYTELLRDESRHGAFGARAAEWLLTNWSPERRRALWPLCVAEMENFERRAGTTNPRPSASTIFDEECDALGRLPRAVAQEAVLAAIPRWVLPRLAKLGVLPEESSING